jgi:hypothetical protein
VIPSLARLSKCNYCGLAKFLQHKKLVSEEEIWQIGFVGPLSCKLGKKFVGERERERERGRKCVFWTSSSARWLCLLAC